MKKFVLCALLLMSFGLIFAELEVTIPFDMDIVGASFAATGAYAHETEWMTITNTGDTSQNYTLEYSYENMPDGWYMSLCNHENCFMPNWPVPLALAAGESEEVHILVNVASAGMLSINITLSEGDLTEPMSLDFTFRTEDYVVSADETIVKPRLVQNYPNPFNPSTTISFDLSAIELTEANIAIYNVKGQTVKTFNNLTSNSVTWNGTDNEGKKVDSGIYFYQLTTSTKSETKKMVLLK